MRLAEKALLQDIEVQRRGVCAALTARSKLTASRSEVMSAENLKGQGLFQRYTNARR